MPIKRLLGISTKIYGTPVQNHCPTPLNVTVTKVTIDTNDITTRVNIFVEKKEFSHVFVNAYVFFFNPAKSVFPNVW